MTSKDLSIIGNLFWLLASQVKLKHAYAVSMVCIVGFFSARLRRSTRMEQVFFQWLKDGLAGRPQHIERIGIAYMCMGARVPNKSGKAAENEFHVGPHIMLVSPHPEDLQGLNLDGSTGMSYVTHLPGADQLFLVIPIRRSDNP